ncbi:MAG TPA: transcriptional regulator [Propionibacteriaceae bacterium]|nr:transcriptional regulator [Propionibacteriaceae bacterium]HBY22162.1 transcriptional regulator [Propionibacteriaceae bacterium]
MYTVSQVSALTGVAEGTLRVWERRYGVVSPQRSSGGYRLYDEGQLTRLREMATLVRGGVPASRAAETVSALLAYSGDIPDADAWPPADALIDAAASLEPARLDAVIAQAFGAAPFEQVAETWLLPALVRLGRAWESGRLTVAQEHFASAGLMRAVAGVFDEAQPDAAGAPVLVGLPPGERHEVALFAFATCLRRAGENVIYLGADVPAPDWQRAAETRRARAVVLGVHTTAAVVEARAVVARLNEVALPLSIWVGGALRHDLAGVHHLPDSVASAASELHLSLLGGRG